MNSIITIALRGATLVSRFILMLVIAKFLAPSELGMFGLFMAALAFALLAMGLEFYAFSMRELMSATDNHRAAMIRDNLVLFMCGYVLLTPALIPIFVMDLLPTDLLPWFLVLAVVEHLSHESTRTLVALSRPILANIVLFVRVAAWIYCMLAFSWFADYQISLEGIFVWWLSGAALSLVVAGMAMKSLPWRHAWRTRVNWSWILKGLRTARPFIITAASALGLAYFDRFILNAVSGAAAVGALTFFYGVATATYTIVNASVAHVRLPLLVRAWNEGGQERYRSELALMLKNTLCWALPIGVLAAIAIYPVVTWIDRPEYHESLNAFHVLLLASILRCAADAPVYGLYAQRRDHVLLRVNLAAFLVSLSGNLLLIPYLGVLGCALSAVAGTAVLGIAAAWSLRHSPVVPVQSD